MNNIPDIISADTEKLVHASYELPTAKHVRFEIEQRTLSQINKKYFSLRSLNKAILDDRLFNSVPVVTCLGYGQRVAVDGTLEDIHDDNMVAEHISGMEGKVA